MKLKHKKTLCAVAAMAFILALPLSAYAKSQTITGAVGTYNVTASSVTSAQAGTSTTASVSSAVTCTVSATYHYVNSKTYTTGSQSKTATAAYAAGAGFSAPTNCYTVTLSASHKATWNGQTWTGSTSVTGY